MWNAGRLRPTVVRRFDRETLGGVIQNLRYDRAAMVAALWTYFIPIYVLAFLVLLLGIFALLSRVAGGKYIRPVVVLIQKVPLFRRGLEKASRAAIERQNPELASAIRKIERAGGTRDPQRAQAALARLTPQERRAYMAAAEEQGVLPQGEGLGRAERRRLEKMQRQLKKGR